MGQALCDLHWTADQFWASTPHEFYAACEVGFSRSKEGREREKRDKFSEFRKGLEDAGVA